MLCHGTFHHNVMKHALSLLFESTDGFVKGQMCSDMFGGRLGNPFDLQLHI